MEKNKSESIHKAKAGLNAFLELCGLTLDDIVPTSDSKPEARYLTLAAAARYCQRALILAGF